MVDFPVLPYLSKRYQSLVIAVNTLGDS